jgi:hypothetical protein
VLLERIVVEGDDVLVYNRTIPAFESGEIRTGREVGTHDVPAAAESG